MRITPPGSPYTGTLLETFAESDNSAVSVAFSRNGQLVAYGSRKGKVTVRHTNGQLIGTMKEQDFPVWALTFSPEGNSVASTSGSGIHLWNLATGDISSIGTKYGELKSIDFNHDGTMLVTGNVDKTIQLWSVESKSLLYTLMGHRGIVSSVAFSPNGQLLASASQDTTVKLWDIANQSLIHTFEDMSREVAAVKFSPDGSTLAAAGVYEGVMLWNLQTKKVVHKLVWPALDMYSLAFDPYGKTIAATGAARVVKIWRLRDGELLHELEAHDDWITCIDYCPMGHLATVGNDQKVILWKLRQKEDSTQVS